MDKTKNYKIIMQSAVILLGIFLLASLALPLIKIISPSYYYSGAIYIVDTGFNLLSFSSVFSLFDFFKDSAQPLIIIFGILSVLQLLLSLSIIAMGFIGFFTENKKLEKTVFILMIIGIVFGLIYMLEGIIYNNLFSFHLQNDSRLAEYDAENNIISSTAWLSFFLCALSFIMYIIFKIVKKRELLTVSNQVENINETQKFNKKKSTNINTTFNPIELLKQYKELLDMGTLTQEEFDIKKKELL